MSLIERQKQFLEAAQSFLESAKPPRELFGVSNSAKIIEGGIQLGVVNLDNLSDDLEAISFACVMRFPPEDEVYFAVHVGRDRTALLTRLADMKRLGAAEAGEDDDADSTDAVPTSPASTIKYAKKNNNVPVYLAGDGKLWLRNKGFWDSLNFDRATAAPSVEPDKVAVALYPPTASAKRSLLAREFIGWLAEMVGPEKVHEIKVWSDESTLSQEMKRLPASISITEIEAAVSSLGGHYPNGEVRRLHSALNFLSNKHFVILSGLSGTGKTQLALKYARAVHGVTSMRAQDPLIFECPVRPEWTDPTGLTGYFDVLSNRYVVPTFLEAVLVATAHRDSPVFVILDEMNLARVEHYFSDVLSCIETGGALRLHSSGVPLEGTTGASIRAEMPLPSNLFIIGTINVDETTNQVSDKVLDRANVIEMSDVDLTGFLGKLAASEPSLKSVCETVAKPLMAAHSLLAANGMGFGYRTAEEFVRYHHFNAEKIGLSVDEVTDELLVQKVLVKLRGAERQRKLLVELGKVFAALPRTTSYLKKLTDDLDEYGSFQAMR
jgi:5-methylcytosine-specific restriction protein B